MGIAGTSGHARQSAGGRSWPERLKRSSRNSASCCRRRRRRSPITSPFVRTGNLLVVSGQLCLDADGKLVAKGKLGGGVSIEDGQKAARACAINLLAQVKAALGDLDKVARVVRLGGFINSAPDFLDGPKVMNGASDLMVDGLRRQGPACPHHGRRRGAAARRRGRGRGRVRGRPDRAMPHARLADRAAGRPSRPARRRGRRDREHAVGLRAPRSPATTPSKCDLQITADGEAMVHHDDALGRLTEGDGRLDAMTAAALQRVAVQGHRRPHDHARRAVRPGRRPRRRWCSSSRAASTATAGWPRAPRRCCAATRARSRVMSFDPGQIAALREAAPGAAARHRRRAPLSRRHRTSDRADAQRSRYAPARARGAGRSSSPIAVQRPAVAAAAARAQRARLPLLTWTVRTRGGPRPRRALGRPDDFRGISAIMSAARPVACPPSQRAPPICASASFPRSPRSPPTAWDACANPDAARLLNQSLRRCAIAQADSRTSYQPIHITRFSSCLGSLRLGRGADRLAAAAPGRRDAPTATSSAPCPAI